MTSREFFFLVAQMRDAQRRYFRDRDRAVFLAARALENDVDHEIARVRAILLANEDENKPGLNEPDYDTDKTNIN